MMKNRAIIFAAACCILIGAISRADSGEIANDLAKSFVTPAESVRPWVYWWWLNGYVTKEGIVRDLDEMRAQGINGALVFDAGGGTTPKTIEFMSRDWRELFRFAVQEAARRNIVLGLNLCSGWNAGGPWVKPEDAAKVLVYSSVRVAGPAAISAEVLPPGELGARPSAKAASKQLKPKAPASGKRAKAKSADDNYHDVAVLAWQLGSASGGSFAQPCLSRTWRELKVKVARDGHLAWEVPAGDWVVVRFGWRIDPRAHTKLTGGVSGLEVDPLSADAMDRHFAATVGVVLQDVNEYAGKTWQFVHIDSGEIGNPDWTPKFREDFRRLRGYDPLPYFAAKAGRSVDSPAMTERFMEDYERTIGDLMIECYYGRLGELAHRHGLGTHSEAAGYQKPTVDALRSMGCNDIAMSEFWSRQSQSESNTYIHQLSSEQLRYHDGIKNASSAAHIYGRKITQAEAFTVMFKMSFAPPPHGVYPNWSGDPFSLKAVGDRAFCAGLNRIVFHHFFHQPEPDDQAPGYVWPYVGIEINRKTTWWPLIHGWTSYLCRCQSMLQAGRFAADVCYFQGDWVPAFVPARWAMDPTLPPGYDCDTINTEALLTRAGVDNGRLVLPDGQSYRYLALWQGGRWQRPSFAIFNKPSEPSTRPAGPAEGSAKPLALSPATLRKLKELVQRGLTLVGPRPDRAIGLTDYPASDEEVKKLADDLWGTGDTKVGRRNVGKGRVIWGTGLAQVMQADGAAPDLDIIESPATAALPVATFSGIPSPGTFDWIHRTVDDAEVYFIANLRNAAAAGQFDFRISTKQPELWDPLTGKMRDAMDLRQVAGRTVVPLEFAPRGSLFVVFRMDRRPNTPAPGQKPPTNFPKLSPLAEIAGPWTVRFDPKWDGPASVEFAKLEDWTHRGEPGIKYYSGKATYERLFDLPPAAGQSGKRIYLDLGKLKNMAEVRVNGKSLGVVWTAPWRVELTGMVQPAGNRLEIDVVNLWSNRMIGDARLPPEKRLTKSNSVFDPDLPLLESGLLGPVTILMAE